jgi:hypothetical protein
MRPSGHHDRQRRAKTGNGSGPAEGIRTGQVTSQPGRRWCGLARRASGPGAGGAGLR